MKNEYASVNQLHKESGIPSRTIHNWIEKGQIEAQQMGYFFIVSRKSFQRKKKDYKPKNASPSASEQ